MAIVIAASGAKAIFFAARITSSLCEFGAAGLQRHWSIASKDRPCCNKCAGLEARQKFAQAPSARVATSTIPIVVAVSNDPVQAGLVASLAHPGGNITGVTFVSSDLAAKRLQFLREIAPNLARVAVIWNPDHVDPEYRETQAAAKTLGIQIQSLEVRSAEDFDAAFQTAMNARIQALIPITSRLMLTNRPRIIEFSSQHQLLLASGFGPWAREGALLSYGPDTDASTQRAAAYVDKILRGAKPDELPIEQPTKFQLVINGKTAKSLGLDIPPTLLATADRVIE